MATLHITIGSAASGKSTWARSTGFKVVERDELRRILGIAWGDFSREAEVTRLRDGLIRQFLYQGLDVVSSDTNLKESYRNELRRLAAEFGADVHVHVFDTPGEVCKERNATRPDDTRVPEPVMVNMIAAMRRHRNDENKEGERWEFH